eukprot:COSAG05_NODE_2678_length_2775_cov_13.724589_2_plen_350_part_00
MSGRQDRVSSADEDLAMTDDDRIAKKHYLAAQRIQSSGSAEPEEGANSNSDNNLTSIVGAKRLSGRLSGLEDDEELNRSTRDLNAIVNRQTRRRKRRASVEIMASDQELLAKGRWNRIQSGVKMGAQISAVTRSVGEERQELDTMKRRLKRSLTQREVHDTCTGCVMHPRSKFRQRWDGMLFAMLMYCAFIIPFRLGFDVNAENAVLIWEAIIDCSFLVDVVLSFRTGYMLDEENEDSRIEMLPRAIAKNYVRKWFFVDLISAFPTQLIALMSDDKGKDASSSNSVSKLPRLLRVPKLVRMIRLMKVFRILRLFKSSQQGIFTNLIEKSGLPPVRTMALRCVYLRRQGQ